MCTPNDPGWDTSTHVKLHPEVHEPATTAQLYRWETDTTAAQEAQSQVVWHIQQRALESVYKIRLTHGGACKPPLCPPQN